MAQLFKITLEKNCFCLIVAVLKVSKTKETLPYYTFKNKLVNSSLDYYISDGTPQKCISWQKQPNFGHFQPHLKNV